MSNDQIPTPKTDDAWQSYDRGACGLRYIRHQMGALERELAAASQKILLLEQSLASRPASQLAPIPCPVCGAAREIAGLVLDRAWGLTCACGTVLKLEHRVECADDHGTARDVFAFAAQ